MSFRTRRPRILYALDGRVKTLHASAPEVSRRPEGGLLQSERHDFPEGLYPPFWVESCICGSLRAPSQVTPGS
jgi:hypothetical protein